MNKTNLRNCSIYLFLSLSLLLIMTQCTKNVLILNSIDPDTGLVHQAWFWITAHGNNFNQNCRLVFADNVLETKYIDDTKLQGQVWPNNTLIGEETQLVHVWVTDIQTGDESDKIEFLIRRNPDFSDPIHIPGSKSAELPEIEIDEKDNIYVVWRDVTNEVIKLTCSKDRGATWETPVELPSSKYGVRPKITSSRSENVHVIWGVTLGTLSLKYSSSTDGGNSWTFKDLGALYSFGDIDASYDGKIVVGYKDTASNSGNLNMKCSFDNGESWTERHEIISWSDQHINPGMVVYPYLNDIYVLWETSDQGKGDIYFVFSDDGGSSWKDVVNLSQNPSNSEFPCVSNIIGTINVTFIDDQAGIREIYLTQYKYEGAYWTIPIVISKPVGGKVWYHSLAEDRTGNLNVLWDAKNDYIYYIRSIDNGFSWIDPIPCISKKINGLRTPVIGTDSEGYIYIIWCDYNGIGFSKGS